MFSGMHDVLQVMSCDIGQEYGLHRIQINTVLGFVYHDNFVSCTILSQAVIFSACISICLNSALEEGNLFCAKYISMFLK